MKSFTLSSLAVMAALLTASSAYSADKLVCQPYQGNWVNAPVTLCSTPDVGGGHDHEHTISVSNVSVDR